MQLTLLWDFISPGQMAQVKKNDDMDMGKGEHLFPIGGSEILYNHYGNQCGGSLWS